MVAVVGVRAVLDADNYGGGVFEVGCGSKGSIWITNKTVKVPRLANKEF